MKEKILIILLAMGVLFFWEKASPFRKGAEKGYWKHATNNFLLYSFKIVLNLALFKQTFELIDGWEANQVGFLPALGVPKTAQVVFGLLFLDLGAYLLHLASHKIFLLWRLHRVHHTDTFIDMTTYFRTHPGEAFLAWCWMLFVISLVGVPASAYAAHMLTMVLIALFQHANIRLPAKIEKAAGWLIITPDLHKVHHSDFQPETDSNYGTTLSIWDRVFRTLKPRKNPGQLTYGLGEFTNARWQGFLGLLRTPFA